MTLRNKSFSPHSAKLLLTSISFPEQVLKSGFSIWLKISNLKCLFHNFNKMLILFTFKMTSFNNFANTP